MIGYKKVVIMSSTTITKMQEVQSICRNDAISSCWPPLAHMSMAPHLERKIIPLTLVTRPPTRKYNHGPRGV